MSSNFLDTSGFMLGADIHLFIDDEGGLPKPVLDLYVVGSHHMSWSSYWWIVQSVTTGGSAVLRSSWQMLLIPHLPIRPAHPLEPLELAAIWITSNSAPMLSAHSVTAKGFPLLTAIVGAWGTNSNCGLQGLIRFPFNFDVNLNTVTTTPSRGDYLAAAVGMFLNGIYNAASERLPTPAAMAQFFMQVIADVGVHEHDPVAPRSFDPITQFINWVTDVQERVADGRPIVDGEE